MEHERREDSTGMRARAVSRIRGSGMVTLALALAFAAGVASAAEDTRNRTGSAHKIVVVDSELIRPAALLMSKDDVLEFENYSGHAMTLAFVEPRDQVDKIRCHLADPRPARPDQARWLLYDWSSDQQLTATIPPGRFASVCSLIPGEYTFVVRQVGFPGADDALGTKGTITVQ